MTIHALILALSMLLVHPASAQEAVDSAGDAYRAGKYDQALSRLSNLEGLLEVAPIFDRLQGEERERVLFELARCRFALGDSSGAQLVLGELYRCDPRQSKGAMDVQRDAPMDKVLDGLRTLRRRHQQEQINETSPVKAAARSLVIPGWGQQYRGRKGRGRFLMVSAGVVAAGWFLADRSYRSALDGYRLTSDLDLSLPARTGGPGDPNPFEERFSKVESRASTARALGLMLASIWVYSVVENIVIQPGRVAVTVPLD